MFEKASSSQFLSLLQTLEQPLFGKNHNAWSIKATQCCAFCAFHFSFLGSASSFLYSKQDGMFRCFIDPLCTFFLPIMLDILPQLGPYQVFYILTLDIFSYFRCCRQDIESRLLWTRVPALQSRQNNASLHIVPPTFGDNLSQFYVLSSITCSHGQPCPYTPSCILLALPLRIFNFLKLFYAPI